MPLFSLETLPTCKERIRTQISSVFKNIGEKAKKEVIDGLNIPNQADWEVRRVVGNQSKIKISFTIGPHEYPGFSPVSEAFQPPRETIQKVGDNVLALVKNSQLAGVDKVVMEAWSNTTFRPYESGVGEEIPPETKISPDRNNVIGKYIKEPKIRLYLSPDVLTGVTSGEEKLSSESKPFEEVSKEAMNVIVETLGLPENVERQVVVVVTDQADTPVSFEFDCKLDDHHLIPEEIRMQAVDRLEFLLRIDPATKNHPGEIWFRQGEPTIVTTSSQN